MSEYSKIMRLCSCEFGSFFLKNKFWHQINKKKVLCCIDLFDFRIEDKVCENLSNSFGGSVTQSCLTAWPHGLQHTRLPLSFTIFWCFLKLMSSNCVILFHPLFLLPSIFPTIKVFSNESVLPIRWPKYWNFSFSISPSNEYSEPISFSIDWFDLQSKGLSRVFSKILGSAN